MSRLTRSETAAWLTQRNDFLILSHRRPDGDTIGSSAALCLGLRKLGKRAWILRNREITPKYARLHQGLTVEAALPEYTVVAVDTATAKLLPAEAEPLLGKIHLRIDHHGTAESFTPDELVDPRSASCAEIIYDLLDLLGAQPDQAIAEALYIGLSTDTGCFRYANTTPHTYRTAAACMEAGADIHGITQDVFETNSFAKLSMQSWILHNTRFYESGTVAICALPRKVEQRIGVTEDDMDSISGFPRSIEGVRLAAMLRQLPDGRVKVSVRAVPGEDAAAICVKFGGGGHKGAAGATLELPLEEAADAVVKAMCEKKAEQI